MFVSINGMQSKLHYSSMIIHPKVDENDPCFSIAGECLFQAVLTLHSTQFLFSSRCTLSASFSPWPLWIWFIFCECIWIPFLTNFSKVFEILPLMQNCCLDFLQYLLMLFRAIAAVLWSQASMSYGPTPDLLIWDIAGYTAGGRQYKACTTSRRRHRRSLACASSHMRGTVGASFLCPMPRVQVWFPTKVWGAYTECFFYLSVPGVSKSPYLHISILRKNSQF